MPYLTRNIYSSEIRDCILGKTPFPNDSYDLLLAEQETAECAQRLINRIMHGQLYHIHNIMKKCVNVLKMNTFSTISVRSLGVLDY